MQASVLRATLVTRADDELLRPLVRPHLLPAAPGPTDHEIIGAGLLQVETAGDARGAARTAGGEADSAGVRMGATEGDFRLTWMYFTI